MLYFLTKQLTIAAVRIFFDSITAKHIDHIPDEGPVIFVANHPNTLMDPLVIGTTCPRQLHFFAKSPLFNSWFNRTILTRLKLVPIYRKQDNPKQMDKNDQTFARGFDILENGGSFLIFPEGVSTGDRVLEKIKTGAARIGLGAEEKNNFNLNVNIIPVGLSYSNAIKFRSDILVRYGKPISLKSFKNAYSHDSIETVHQITSQIESALSKLTTNVNEIEVMDIVECLERIYETTEFRPIGGLRMEDYVDEDNGDIITLYHAELKLCKVSDIEYEMLSKSILAEGVRTQRDSALNSVLISKFS